MPIVESSQYIVGMSVPSQDLMLMNVEALNQAGAYIAAIAFMAGYLSCLGALYLRERTRAWRLARQGPDQEEVLEDPSPWPPGGNND